MNHRRNLLALGACALVGLSIVLILSAGLTARADASWGFSLTNLDKSCKPCEDFYKFAMGGWMKANPIPAEYPNWGTFTELRDHNLTAMRTILDSAASSNALPGSNERKIGDFYASCMDTTAIDDAGLKPLTAELATIDAIKDRAGLDAEIARLHKLNIGAAFDFGSSTDFKDSTHYLAEADQGGLGMPDRDYYTRDDDRSRQLRVDYVQHVAKIFELAGDPPDKAAAQAKAVMDLETSLAKASRTNVELRDPEKKLQQDDPRRDERAHARLVLGKLFSSCRRAARHFCQHRPAGIFQGNESPVDRNFRRRLEDLS
jgi:putative endopeptidase